MVFIQIQDKRRQATFVMMFISLLALSINPIFAQDCELEDCVMPGDTNSDGMANVWDLLRLGPSYGMAGPPRIEVSTDWSPQEGANWPMAQFDGTNYKHVDCNGDGLVTSVDISAIADNYEQEPAYVSSPDTDANYLLSLDIINETLSEGEPIHGHISLTSKNGSPVEDIYGIALRLNFNEDLINSIEIDYDGWLGESFELLTVDKAFNNRVDIGATRMCQSNIDGSGDVIGFIAVMEEIILGETVDLELLIEDVVIVDRFGNTHPVDVENINQSIETTTGLLKVQNNGNLNVFPNPATNTTQFQMDKGLEVSEMRIVDISGKTVKFLDLPESKENTFNIDLTDLQVGMYFVKIVVNQGILQHPIVIAR